MKAIPKEEFIWITCMIDKYSKDREKFKRRLLMVTNLALYIISGNFKTAWLKSIIKNNSVIKRRIAIDKIKGISISTQSFEFVVHVPSEYDQRFGMSPDK